MKLNLEDLTPAQRHIVEMYAHREGGVKIPPYDFQNMNTRAFNGAYEKGFIAPEGDPDKGIHARARSHYRLTPAALEVPQIRALVEDMKRAKAEAEAAKTQAEAAAAVLQAEVTAMIDSAMEGTFHVNVTASGQGHDLVSIYFAKSSDGKPDGFLYVEFYAWANRHFAILPYRQHRLDNLASVEEFARQVRNARRAYTIIHERITLEDVNGE